MSHLARPMFTLCLAVSLLLCVTASADPPDPLISFEFAVPGVVTLAFSPDGDRLAVGRENTVGLWDARTGQPLGHSADHEHLVRQVLFTPGGEQMVTVTHRAIHFWHAETLKPAGPNLILDEPGLDVAGFTPDGKRVLLLMPYHFAQMWDVTTGKPVWPPLRHPTPRRGGERMVTLTDRGIAIHFGSKQPVYTYTAALSADGTKLLTSGSDGTARLWDAATAEPLLAPIFHEGAPDAAPVLSNDGTRILTLPDGRDGDYAGTVWDAALGRQVARLGKRPYGRRVNGAAFSPDCKWVATGGRGDFLARVWNAVTGEPVTPWLRHVGEEVSPVAFSPDGRKLLTYDEYGQAARLWDAATGEMIHTTEATWATLSPDGRRLLTLHSPDRVRVWDLDKLDAVRAAERAGGE